MSTSKTRQVEALWGLKKSFKGRMGFVDDLSGRI
jgi:hypothetical protein